MRALRVSVALHNIKLPNNQELLPDRAEDKDLAELLLEARKNETPRSTDLRKHFLGYMDSAIPILKKTSLTSKEQVNIHYVENDLRSAMMNELSIELCDAIHVVAVLNPCPVKLKVPIKFEEIDGIIKFVKADLGDCDGFTFLGLDAQELKEKIKSELW